MRAPRADNALHDLTEILFIALLATLCGATACTDMALFARMKAYLWQDVLVLKNGLPSHDTFSRVFRMLDPAAFEKAFQRFMIAFAQGAKIKRPKGVIALDGKALSPVQVIESLESVAAPFGVGRGIHLGDTIIGTKGRVAFEAPAAETQSEAR